MYKKHLTSVGISLLMTFFISAISMATELKLGSPFQEHMVLQRNMPLNVWGEAKPNSTVNISFNNKETTSIADVKGNWKATLDAQKAGGPFTFSVKSNEESIDFKDVMVGEVWVCSGQSNMSMGYDQIPNIKALKPLAKNIRTFKVQNTVAFTEQKYLNAEWKLENPNSAVAFSFAYFLQKAANVPVGIILTSWGSSSIEGWMPRDMTNKLPYFKQVMLDFDTDLIKKERIDSILSIIGNRKTKDDILLRTQPNIIFNAMMKPLTPYTCRGIVWYQGEANTKSMESMLQYGITLPLWIERIRTEFQNENLHFLGVMLPGFGGNLMKKQNPDSLIESPTTDSWAWMRESQLKALNLKNANIATTIDLGEKNNIHPKDKLPVGQRLALLAQRYTLGMKIVADGPIFKKSKVAKNKIIVEFESATGLKTVDRLAPKAFWLADDNKIWYKATASIKGKKVILESTEIAHPLYVRYAFAAKPEVNLVNASGFPARPFRTDTFE